MASNVQSAAPATVYHMKYRTLLWVGAGINLPLVVRGLDNQWSPFFWVFILVVSIFFVWTAQTTRLVISPAGIAFDTLGSYSVVTAWSHVERVAEIPHRSGGTFRALLLREPAAIGWPYLDAALLPEHRGRAIPLSGPTSFPHLWGQVGELEQEIQHYAPHALP